MRDLTFSVLRKNPQDDRSQQVCKTEVTYYDAESNHKRLG